MGQAIFKYKSVIENEGKMYDDVRSFLITEGITSPALSRIMLALSESFTNAMIHGNCFDENKTIEVCLKVNEDYIIADIIDEGDGKIDMMKSRQMPDPEDEGGRGWDLIETLADKVLILKNDRTAGLQVTMHFRRGKNSKLNRQRFIKGVCDGNQ